MQSALHRLAIAALVLQCALHAADLQWDGAADSYRVEWAELSEPLPLAWRLDKSLTTTERTASIPTTPGKTYSVTVFALKGGKEAMSREIRFTASATPFGPPMDIRVVVAL